MWPLVDVVVCVVRVRVSRVCAPSVCAVRACVDVNVSSVYSVYFARSIAPVWCDRTQRRILFLLVCLS